MNIRKTLADNMRKLRRAAGVSQEGLADICGLHRTYIGGIEEEKINVSIKNLSKIADVFGVPTALLLASFDGIDPKSLICSKNFPKKRKPKHSKQDSETVSPKESKDLQAGQNVYAACVIYGNEVEFITLSEEQYNNAITKITKESSKD